jgi:hypothetical protein
MPEVPPLALIVITEELTFVTMISIDESTPEAEAEDMVSPASRLRLRV